MNDNTLMKKVEDTDKALQDIVELSILYDFYSELLGTCILVSNVTSFEGSWGSLS